ncbi:hypothetical protein BT67DRAFT_59627 [Trichocladium antarcticum]|uniref:Rhodopsin domain-containing protein n=1 Tax=Trichocladium antarcticum TaxID=1450529 RepID=A0AAN6UHP3_9PEZI|nr:hypothetical protein BT67DRAFT_59627 [Trichocladium antarcticum]
MANGVESFVLLGLMLVIIAFRTFVRWRRVGLAHLQLDDYLMVLAGILCTIVTVAASLVVTRTDGLTNSYMTDEERAALSPDSQEHADRVLGSKIQVLGWTLYAASLWCIKVCVAVFYSRLTYKLPHWQVRIYIAYGLIGVTWVVVTLCLLVGCRPISKYWQISPDPGICQPTNSKLYVFAVLIPDVITDLFLLSIPLPLLWTVNLSLRKKIPLAILFCGVIFVIMAAIIRGVVILSSGPEGAISGSEWSVREEFVSVVVANLPVVQAPIRAFCNKIGLSVLFSKGHSTNTDKPYAGRTIGGGGGGGGISGISGGGYPLRTPKGGSQAPGTTAAWDSDEQILCENANSCSSSSNNNNNNNIVVAREIAVESEAGSLKEPSRWTVSVAGGADPWKEQQQKQQR